jgi:uncharacterized membrane-anchored protein YhcB (DUF1043 family)
VENVYAVWQISIISLIAGALIGALAYRLLAPSVKQAGKIKSELDVSREELDSYKASVNQHFNETSELVNDLTQNYVKVYQHLAEGAQTLGDSKTFTNLLEQHQGRVSIAVDDETNVTNKVADDLVVEPAVTQATSVEMLDEHAEPLTDEADGVTESVSSESVSSESVSSGDDPAKTGASKSAGSPDDPDEASEPVLNVDALEEATENTDIETQPEAGSAVPEGKEKIEVRTTVH